MTYQEAVKICGALTQIAIYEEQVEVAKALNERFPEFEWIASEPYGIVVVERKGEIGHYDAGWDFIGELA